MKERNERKYLKKNNCKDNERNEKRKKIFRKEYLQRWKETKKERRYLEKNIWKIAKIIER